MSRVFRIISAAMYTPRRYRRSDVLKREQAPYRRLFIRVTALRVL